VVVLALLPSTEREALRAIRLSAALTPSIRHAESCLLRNKRGLSGSLLVTIGSSPFSLSSRARLAEP